MLAIVEKLLPIFLAFFAAVVARQTGVLRRSHGESLLKVAFYLTIPPLVFVSALRIQLQPHLLIFLLLPVLLALATFLLGGYVLGQ